MFGQIQSSQVQLGQVGFGLVWLGWVGLGYGQESYPSCTFVNHMTNSIMENTSYDLLHNVNHNDYNHMIYSIWVYDLLTYGALRAHFQRAMERIFNRILTKRSFCFDVLLCQKRMPKG